MVEWKKLGEICEIARGASPRPIKNYITNDVNGVNWIKIGDVAPNTKFITSVQEKITKEGAEKSRFLHIGDFILSNSMSFGRPYILKVEGCIHDGWIAMSGYDKYVSSGYLYEILSSHSTQDYWKTKANNGGAMSNLNSDIVKGTIIPIPSLSEQERIVGILDTFTASIDNIKAQIEQRRKQYEHYRNTLLTFNKDDDSVEWKTLGEVAYYPQEKISASKLNKTNYVSVENLLQNKAGKVYSSCCPQEGNWKKYEIGDILIGNIRPNLRKIWLANIIGGTNGDVLTIRINDTYKHNISTNFLYYILSSEDFFLYDIQNAKGAKMPRGDKKVVLDYPIPIPSLQEQQRTVSILDTFEASITNLEAQLEQRQKQYEYYREKLLTFE